MMEAACGLGRSATVQHANGSQINYKFGLGQIANQKTIRPRVQPESRAVGRNRWDPMTLATGSTPKIAAATPPGSPSGKTSKRSLAAKAKVTGFLANTKREMQIEFLGEGTPGPGSYLPASSFGKHSARPGSPASKMALKQSSSFKSTSAQRPKAKNAALPGPGSHNPNPGATSAEKKKVNARSYERVPPPPIPSWIACPATI